MGVLRILAFPISLLYGGVVSIRNKMYDLGIFKSNKMSVPTVCVGNLSVGGTGKTPMVEFLLRSYGTDKTAVLSRGYRRKSRGFVLADASSTVEDLGDEPYQIHRKFPDIPVAVDVNRAAGIQRLRSECNPNLILLDDAFQHRHVRPDFSILLTAFSK